MEKMQNNTLTLCRWKVAIAAVAVHLCIGSVYAWSVFVKPLQLMYDWTKQDLTWTFSIAIVVLGLSAALSGSWMENKGPHRSAQISALAFGLGIIGAGVASHIGSLWLLYLTYGVLGGIGLGLGYISPVSTLVKWFPDKRGLATGMAVFGFGAGSLITGPIAADLIENLGVPGTFYILGFAYLAIIFAASSFLYFPPEGYKPEGWDPNKSAEAGKGFCTKRNFEVSEALKTPQFWLLWILFFINISAGIMLISLASPMAQEIVGFTPIQAGFMVGLMGIFNGAGRIFWSSVSDYIGRAVTYGIMFLVQIVLFILLPSLKTAILFQLAFFIILTCYGGGFATCPAFIADMFGASRVGAIHGIILTAWSSAGIFGPIFGAYIREHTKSYCIALYAISGALFAALICTLFIYFILRRLSFEERNN